MPSAGATFAISLPVEPVACGARRPWNGIAPSVWSGLFGMRAPLPLSAMTADRMRTRARTLAAQLFLGLGVRGFPWGRRTIDDAAPQERHDWTWSATSSSDSPAGRACQHIAAPSRRPSA
jgi:hypothetical protein